MKCHTRILWRSLVIGKEPADLSQPDAESDAVYRVLCEQIAVYSIALIPHARLSPLPGGESKMKSRQASTATTTFHYIGLGSPSNTKLQPSKRSESAVKEIHVHTVHR